ncbi:Eco57I restriction-modification methylase domain-containing protein [Sphingobacterium sp. UME9]|uniref:Eco57I restriction-modification methylase domain-containing protein n=1 Tax=Sphingobacterium sp. UME9 TaxID=1862316 RepID=UPI0015FF5249|nr:N-6 DNA methylase [Sphingobacterium sp. UME9]MBB1644949.1 N-6 DNA methylase [Sphingobacterium sp. UME9]
MKKIFGFLAYLEPYYADRLIVSAYIYTNEIPINNNQFLLDYLINRGNNQEYMRLCEFQELLIEQFTEITLETVIKLFENVVSPADRIVNGAIYTPINIREYIVNNAFENQPNLEDVIVGDIACGCASFLYTAARELRERTNRTYSQIFRENIYGLDIQGYSRTRAKLLLSLLALSEGEDPLEFSFNLYVGDALTFNWANNAPGFIGFSILLGNPPYVRYRNMDEQTRLNLQHWEVAQVGLTDLYIPFFQIGIENLRPNGILGFITMNSFFKSLNGRALRQYFSDHQLDFIIEDFGAEQIFKSKNTYVCICFIHNRQADAIRYASVTEETLTEPKQHHIRPYITLNSRRGWNLKNTATVTSIENIGRPFGEIYTTRHGIATLKNDIYIFSPVDQNENFFYLKNGQRFEIERDICKEIVNSNKLSRIKDLNSLKERVIFPYIHNYAGVEIMPEEMLQDLYPNAYRYLQYKRSILEGRDKGGAREYNNWYAYGRTQSLDRMRHKLFFPKFSDVTPSFLVDHDEDLMFYNGLALIGESEKDVEIARKIMESKVFWYYIESTSKPYSNKYYSLNSTYINNFGVCDLSEEEIEFLLNETDQTILDEFFVDKYGILI